MGVLSQIKEVSQSPLQGEARALSPPCSQFPRHPLPSPAVAFPLTSLRGPLTRCPISGQIALDVLAQKVTTFTDVGNSLAHGSTS